MVGGRLVRFWNGKKVLVTGGAGFIGSYVVEQLVEREADVLTTVIDNLQSGELRNLERVEDRIKFVKADLRNMKDCLEISKGKEIVMNLAARVRGIEYNRLHPGTMFKDNMLISLNVLDAARQVGVERFLVVSSACVYPRNCTVPTPEEEGFRDTPEPTSEGYGWAKRMAEFMGKAYHREFGMKVAIARPYNCYGPRDYFDAEIGHVIPALIKKAFDGEDPLIVWGNGEQSRAFLYVEDLARGLIEITEKYAVCGPINIGTDEEIKIKDLVKLILELSGKNPKICFDTAKPVGQPRRNCDNTKALEKIGFHARVNIEEGLRNTVNWYKSEYNK